MFRSTGCFLIWCLLSVWGSAQSAIHLKTGDIAVDPAGIVDRITSSNPQGPSHLLLQFRERPTAGLVRSLRLRGVQVLGDVPDNGLLVSLEGAKTIEDLGASYAAAIPPSLKISPLVALAGLRFGERSAGGRLAALRGYFLIEFHPDTDMYRARGTLLSQGLVPIDNPDLNPYHLMVHLGAGQTTAALTTLASLDEVAYVFPASHELIMAVPGRFYAAAITSNGPSGQAIPTYGDGWDGPGCGDAPLCS